MRGLSSLDTLKAIKVAGLDARVIILTVSDSEEDVVSALRAGADSYLLKDMEPEDVLHSLKIAAQGRIALGEQVAEILADSLRHESQPKPADSVGLTEREQKILSLIAIGYSNKLIARELKIVEGTVKVHVKHLLSKLDLDSRVEARCGRSKTIFASSARKIAGAASQTQLKNPAPRLLRRIGFAVNLSS